MSNMSNFELSLKDKKILSTIEVDGRLSYVDIGKKVGLSKQIVKYRMDLLEKQDVIQEYYAIVNDSKLGRIVNFVYIELASLSEDNEKKLILALDKEPRVLSYFSSLGKWDLVIASFAKDVKELSDVLQKLLKPISSQIKSKAMASLGEYNYLSTEILSDLGKNNATTGLDELEKFDELDLKIIDDLMINGRATLVELAGKYKMSANGIKERIKSLEKKGIIVGYKTKINYEALGFLHSHFFVWARDMNDGFYDRVKEFLVKDGRTEAVSRRYGYSDLDFRCNVGSVGELYQLKRKIKNFFKNEINSIESLIVVRSGISHLRKKE